MKNNDDVLPAVLIVLLSLAFIAQAIHYHRMTSLRRELIGTQTEIINTQAEQMDNLRSMLLIATAPTFDARKQNGRKIQ